MTPECVDFLSADLNEFDLHATWRYISKHKGKGKNSNTRLTIRQENVIWRKFFQTRFKLARMDPTKFRLVKEVHEQFTLYGQLIQYSNEGLEKIGDNDVTVIKKPHYSGPRCILKKTGRYGIVPYIETNSRQANDDSMIGTSSAKDKYKVPDPEVLKKAIVRAPCNYILEDDPGRLGLGRVKFASGKLNHERTITDEYTAEKKYLAKEAEQKKIEDVRLKKIQDRKEFLLIKIREIRKSVQETPKLVACSPIISAMFEDVSFMEKANNLVCKKRFESFLEAERLRKKREIPRPLWEVIEVECPEEEGGAELVAVFKKDPSISERISERCQNAYDAIFQIFTIALTLW